MRFAEISLVKNHSEKSITNVIIILRLDHKGVAIKHVSNGEGCQIILITLKSTLV